MNVLKHFSRTYWLVLAMLCVFSVFTIRVIQLQVIQGKRLRSQADDNRFFTRYLPASRGVFYDRNTVVLVKNAPLYKKATDETAFSPYPQFVEVPEQEALQLLSKDERNVVIDQRRTYPFGSAMASVLGYVGEATADELKRGLPYYVGESVGRAGLEKTFQRQLAGRIGKEIFEMQASGKILRPVNREEPIAGVDLRLTIDASFSAFVYEQLGGRRGAIVASDPRTGEILALVSSPSFDPARVADALKDPDMPMLQRAVAGQYPPGSTFKLVTALAALQNGAITADTSVRDEGSLNIGEFSFGNWYFSQYGRVEGEVKLIKAIQRSNDIYFYKVAEWVGPEKIAAFARLFHFGRPTEIELSGEAAGIVPDPEWKANTVGEPWYLGDTYHMGIGQGDVLVTPLQVNQMTAAIANDGVWCKPHLLYQDKVRCEDLRVSPEHLASVVEGMKAACSSGGTAFPFFDKKPIEVACKTGTSEFGPKDEKGHRKTHALITLMAPANDPQIVLTVLLEADEEHPFLEGSADAGPIAKKVLTRWMEQKNGMGTERSGLPVKLPVNPTTFLFVIDR